jgi:DNA polymerase I-like protein with 3'-5' exonuclease and polymerase domains
MPDSIALPQLNPAALVPALNPTVVVDGAGLERLADYLSRVTEFAVDYETNIVDGFYRRRARTLQIGDRNEQYIIDFLAFAGSTDRLIRGQGHYRRTPEMLEEGRSIFEPVVKVIGPAMQSNSHLKLGHNLEFEYVVSKWCLGLRPWNFYCTQIAERLIRNGADGTYAWASGVFGLEDLVRNYLRVEIDKSHQKTFDLETPLTDSQALYAALDVRFPFAVRDHQAKLIREGKLERVTQIEMNAIPPFGDMHLNGILVDAEEWWKIIHDNQDALKEAYTQLDKFFIPVVGRKEAYDPAETARVQGIYEATMAEKPPVELSEPTGREAELAAMIQQSRKDLAYKATLQEQRAVLQSERKQKIEIWKAAWAERKLETRAVFHAERAKGNQAATREYAKMKGEAAINYNSTQQLRAALLAGNFGFDEKNLPDTSDDTFERHVTKAVIAPLRAMRSNEQALKTFGDRWVTPRDKLSTIGKPKPGYVDPDTGRIHGKFLQLGADTGRPSCTNPNLYNIPRQDRYRAAVKSRDGYDMVTKDCSGQELRILTQYSKEPAWVEAFQNKQDVHSISAEMMIPEKWAALALREESTIIKDGKAKVYPACAFYFQNKIKCACPDHKDERDKMKAVNFGIPYDKQAASLALELGIGLTEAETLLANWKRTFLATTRTMRFLRESAYDKGEARSLSGRRRIIRTVEWEDARKSAIERHGKDATQVQVTRAYQGMIAARKREAGNLPIQGSGADMMKEAMGCGFDSNGKPYLWHLLEPEYGALLENYVYDEFVTESPEANSEAVSSEVSDAIIRAAAEFVTIIPMESEGAIAKRWRK